MTGTKGVCTQYSFLFTPSSPVISFPVPLRVSRSIVYLSTQGMPLMGNLILSTGSFLSLWFLCNNQIKGQQMTGILGQREYFDCARRMLPTMFIEIIQRIGCMTEDDQGKSYQKGGCGGFGKGNFSELFKSIEEYEKTLERKSVADA